MPSHASPRAVSERVRGRYSPPRPSASCAPQQRIALRNLFERLLLRLVHRHAHLPPHLDVLHSSRQHDGSGVADSVTQPRRKRATNIHAMSAEPNKLPAWFASGMSCAFVHAHPRHVRWEVRGSEAHARPAATIRHSDAKRRSLPHPHARTRTRSLRHTHAKMRAHSHPTQGARAHTCARDGFRRI
jgi:hypothetical protein